MNKQSMWYWCFARYGKRRRLPNFHEHVNNPDDNQTAIVTENGHLITFIKHINTESALYDC